MEATFGYLLLLALFMYGGAHADKESLDELDRQLDALTSRTVSLTKKLDSLLKEKTQTEYTARALSKKMDDATGKRGGCLRGFFPCSDGVDGTVQCVRDYLVCDGSADCNSGADEASAVCDRMPFTETVPLHGIVLRDECGGYSNIQRAGDLRTGHWTIDTATITPGFPSRPLIKYHFAFKVNTVFTPNVAASGVSEEFAYDDFATYDYATGDVLCDDEHRLVGPCIYEAISPEKAYFTCTLDRPLNYVLNRGLKDSCYIARYVMNTRPALPN